MNAIVYVPFVAIVRRDEFWAMTSSSTNAHEPVVAVEMVYGVRLIVFMYHPSPTAPLSLPLVCPQPVPAEESAHRQSCLEQLHGA